MGVILRRGGAAEICDNMDPTVQRTDGTVGSEHVVLVVSAGALLALLFPNSFVDAFYYFSTDNAELYYAWLVMFGRALHHGYWPFLDPYAFAGSLPFAPLESGAMYPVTILAALVTSPGWSLDSVWFVFLSLSLLHYLLGACGMHLLLRRGFSLGATASMLGALCYAFGGSFVGRFSHQPVLFALAWLPFAVAGIKAFTDRATLPSGALAVVAIWMLGVSSHPQVFLYAGAVVAGAAVWFSMAQDHGFRLGALGRGSIALGLALGLLAPRLLPLVELSRVLVRPESTYTIANLFDSLSPLYYLTLVVPGIFGRHMVGSWGTDHPLGNWDSLLYVGLLPIVCACFACFHRRRRDWEFALLGAATAVFLMLGKYWTASAWVNQHLPLSQALTGLSKLTIVFHFFVALLAAFGAQALLDARHRASIILTAFVVAGTLAALFSWLSPEIVASLRPAGRAAPSEAAVEFAVQSVRLARLVTLAVLLTLLAVLFAPGIGRILLIPVLVADLAISVGHFNPIETGKGKPANYYGRDVAIRVMQRDPDVFRVASMVPPNGGMVYALENVWGYHTAATVAYWNLRPFFGVQDPQNRPMYNLAGIKYQQLGSDLSPYNFSQAAPGLWLNREVLPRAFFVGQCRGFPDIEGMTGYARSSSFHPSRELMLLASDCPRRSEASGSCALRSVAESRERYTADCTVDGGRGWIFFSVVQYPGWTATVDGRPAALVPANIGFYAVPLDAGTHRVDLTYRSCGLVWGLRIAAAAGILSLGLTVMARRRG